MFWECLKITNFPANNSHGKSQPFLTLKILSESRVSPLSFDIRVLSGITNNSHSKVVLLKVSWHRHQDGGGHLNVTHISDITSNNSFSSVNKTETVTFVIFEYFNLFSFH